MRHSQNITLLPRIHPPLFNKCIYATLPESTPPSQNILPFSTTVCDPPRIYPSVPEYTPFSTIITLCFHPRIYPSLPEYTPLPFQPIYMYDPPRIYIPFLTTIYHGPRIYLPPPSQNIPLFSTTICDPPRISPPSQNIRPFSKTICDPPRICPSLPEYFSVLRVSGRFSHMYM